MNSSRGLKATFACVAFVAMAGLTACSSSASEAPASAATSAAAPASSAVAASPSQSAVPEGSEAVEGVVAGSGEGLKIGYISLGDAIPFVKIVSDGIKKAADAAGAELVFCDSELDAAKALDCARTFKTQGVQGILNFQIDEKAAAKICAAGPDVPVIAIDIHQQPCETAFMGADNAKGGSIAGTGLATYFKDNFQCEYDAVVSMEVPSAGEATAKRTQGMLDGFESVCGPIPADKLRRVTATGTTDNGRDVFADTLTALGGAKRIAVLSVNDDISLGAFAAAKAANRQGDIWVASTGADPSSWEEIRSNPNWVGDAGWFPENYGNTGVAAIIQAIKGETLPESLLTNHVWVDKASIEEIYPS